MQGKITNLPMVFSTDTVSSYDAIGHGAIGAIVEVGRRPKEAFDREARNPQQSVRDRVREAAKKTRDSFANEPDEMDMWSRVKLEQAACTVVSARPRVSSSRSASQDAQADVYCSWTDRDCFSGKGSPTNAIYSLLGAHVFRDHSGYGS